MEGILMFVSVVMIVFGILQIILFFKMWGMTDDIRAIKNKYIERNIHESDNIIQSNAHFSEGDIVIYKKNNEQYKITKKVSEDLYGCSTIDGGSHYVLNKKDLLMK